MESMRDFVYKNFSIFMFLYCFHRDCYHISVKIIVLYVLTLPNFLVILQDVYSSAGLPGFPQRRARGHARDASEVNRKRLRCRKEGRALATEGFSLLP